MRPGEQLRYLVLGAQREGNRILGALLKPLGLTPAWSEAIIVLAEREPLTIRELGDLLVCQSDHPSRLVTRMSSAGLLVSEASAEDDRALWLRLTPAARELLPQIRAIEDQLHATIEETFDPDQLQTCLTVLGAFIDGLPAGEALKRRILPPPNPRPADDTTDCGQPAEVVAD